MLPPRAPRPFEELLSRLAAAGAPFRLALLIEGGGLAGFRAAHVLSELLAWSDTGTAMQRDALKELARQRADGEAVVRLRVTAATWAPTGAAAQLLDERRGRLLQAVEAWGEMSATPLTGDPVAALCATIPGMGVAATAEAAAAPLADALAMAPVLRPARLGTSGAHVFLSADGCAQAFDPGAGEPGLDLIHGVMGRGKSVLMAALNLAFCLGGSSGQLPRLAVVDVGPSARGLIELLRDALPPARSSEAAWARMSMDAGSAVNPFDTPLGCRHPGPSVRAVIGNVFALALAPPEGESVGEGIRDVLHASVPRAYRLRDPAAPSAEPTMWHRGRCPEADAALERHGVDIAERTPWWAVVDALFERGETRAAELAQRYAVPTAHDLITASRSPEVRDLIAGALHRDGAALVDAFARLLTAASARLPILFRATQFDLAGARVAAVDVAGAAELGSPEARRAAAIAYMLARQALTAGWWLSEEETAGVPEAYRGWHAERLRASREEPKRLCYDEFHRLEAAPGVIDQVERDSREGRKAGVRVVLASQLLGDFPPRLVEQASRIWTLGAGGRPAEVEALAAAFELSPGAQAAVRHQLTGPSPGRGAPVLLLTGSGSDRREALLFNCLGPIELWALTTQPLDVALRRRLYEALGPREGRRRLAARFPAGTAGPELVRRRRALEEQGQAGTDAGVLEELARELAKTQ